MRRYLTASALAVAALVTGAGSASAGGATTGSEHFTFDWNVPASCDQLPAGLTVTLDGTMRWTYTPGGTFNTGVMGTATDSAGGTYVFSYHNSFQGDPAADFSASDHFNLVGNGPAAKVHAHFTLSVKDGVFTLREHGGSLTLGCDPI
jgi:hypothetical protein